VSWYVAATSANAFQSVTYLPELAERGPATIAYTFGSVAGIRISEWMYAGTSGEFIEVTNMSSAPIDMTGWSIDDNNSQPGAFDLSAFGTLQPGESAIVTEAVANTFRAAWSLGAGAKLIGELGVVSGNNLGRNDQINLYNAAGNLEDQLFYGDQTYEGSIRTQNASGQAPCPAIGQNDVASWLLSTVGDAFGSFTATSGDIGTPGSYLSGICVNDVIYANGFEP
jgi:predicted extracellular nuclease